MTTGALQAGTVHATIPPDILAALDNPETRQYWQACTPLGRNEWLCWIENAKFIETRMRRIARLQHDLARGKRRPCCWPGCMHREHDGR